jgi:uncharacterized protein (TIGR02001 family)
MKKSLKKSVSSFISLSLFTSGMVAASAVMTTASAEVTFNAGVMSQYIFRGAVQRDSASLMGGADYTHESGFYAGVWAAQVGTEKSDNFAWAGYDGTNSAASNGWEVDFYGGIKKEVSGVTLGGGFTSYQYTNKTNKAGTKGFDSAYNELNFSAAYGPFTATINPGYHEKVGAAKDASYVFSSLKAEYLGFYGLLGHWEYDKNGLDGDYQQVGYKTSLAGLDLDAAFVHSSKNLNTVGKNHVLSANPKDNTTFAVSVSKSF